MASYPLDRYLNCLTVSSPMFTPKDERLNFRYDSTGVMQIWELDEPGRWPRQRTFTDEAITFAAWSPTGDELVFGMDRDGNERTQLYLLDDADETVTKLTDDPSVVHRWGCWSRDGTRFAYAANRQRPGAFDVFVQHRDGTYEDAQLVCKQDKPSAVVPLSWGPNDEQLLVYEAHSGFNNDIHLVDVETGEVTQLTEGVAEQVRYNSVTWGPDGDGLYLITDRHSEWLYIAHLSLQSGELTPVVQTEANIQSMVLNASVRRIGYVQYENGYSRIVTGELTDETTVAEFPEPAFPSGVADGLAMSNDGERLATVFCTPDTKPDLFTIDIESGATTQWTDSSLGVPEDIYVAPEPITYESFDGLEIPAFYVEPTDPEERPMPAMIDIHGGPRSQYFPAISPIRQYYVDQGFVRLEPNYRGSAGYGKEYMTLDDVEKRPDSIRDIKMAADWLAEQDHVDENRIVLHGASYGGFMVLAAMTRWPDRFAGGVAVAPIANFETFMENTSPWRRKLREAEYGSLEEHRDLLATISPIHDIENINAPLFIAHGENDARVPVGEALQVAERLDEQDTPVELMIVEDEGHHLARQGNRIEVYRAASEFLDENL